MTELACRKHLRTLNARVRLLLQRHMRRFPERLVDSKGMYAQDLIGHDELQRGLGLEYSGAIGEAWLDGIGVPSLDTLEAQLVEQAEEQDAWLQGLPADAWLPLEELRGSLSLSDVEVDALCLTIAPALSVELERVMRVVLADSPARLTLGVLCEMVGASLDLMSPGSALARFRLLELSAHPAWNTDVSPPAHALVSVPTRLLAFVRSLERQPEALAFTHYHGAPSPSTEHLVLEPEFLGALRDATRTPRARLLLLGQHGSGRRTALRALLAALNQGLLEVHLTELLSAPGDARTRLAEVFREAMMWRAWVMLRVDTLPSSGAVAHALGALIEEFPGSVVITCESTPEGVRDVLGVSMRMLRVAPPSGAACRAHWERSLERVVGAERAEALVPVVSHYRLAPGRAVQIIEAAAARGRRRVTGPSLLRELRAQMEHRLGWLADPVHVDMTLGDVVMTASARGKVEEVLRYAQHAEMVFDGWGFGERGGGGRGLSALFTGPPGTGKTLVAGVIARALGRVLYRVDLSRIVDKYIGETEKNLARVFDEAERAQAVLLFDEADSLFAKRTEVRSSNDRYANLEVNFLLQRIDDFAGVSILTTNLAQSIDEAFQRRIRFTIEFPMPDEAMRAELWRRLMPPRAPAAEGIRWSELGEMFELTGGHIRNAILRAAMTAAAQQRPIDTRMLWTAALDECRELGVLVTEGSMGYRDDEETERMS